VDLSNIYLDVLKDRLYCDGRGSHSRRCAQTALAQILDSLIRLLAPILVHTCEEAWAALPHRSQACDSVHLARLPEVDSEIRTDIDEARWDTLLEGFGLEHFAELCIVSKVQVTHGTDDTIVSAIRSSDAKCARCWNHRSSVGSLDAHPDLCHRCAPLL
jgi:isoleucyl-tRNA synthetase